MTYSILNKLKQTPKLAKLDSEACFFLAGQPPLHPRRLLGSFEWQGHGVNFLPKIVSHVSLVLNFKCTQHAKNVRTVDGRNPANQLRLVVEIPLFTRFYASQVVQDFFHQQQYKTN